jgi:cell division protein ZapA
MSTAYWKGVASIDSAASKDAQTTSVTILGTEYPVRSTADPAHVLGIAEMVDTAMRNVSKNRVAKSTGDVAVMAAMNLADDLSRTRRHLQEALRQVAETTDALEKVLDEVEPVVQPPLDTT